MTKSEPSLHRPSTFEVLGVAVDAVTMADAIRRIANAARRRFGGRVIFCTASSVLSALDSPGVRIALRDALLVTPDGMPLVWLGKRRSEQPIERVYGPDFMIAFFKATGDEFKHFFFGGAPGVADEMATALARRFPQLRVVGTYSPPFRADVEATPEEIELIRESGADLVWVGLGHPKQELWMARNEDALKPMVLAGVGAAFDFHSGRKKEAPEWMKRSGLQWLHRIASEPGRLWKRYLIGNSRFVYLLVREWVVGKFRQR